MNAVKIAIRMETDAITFYRDAATTEKNTVGQEMFLSIASPSDHAPRCT
ncbi:MAG: hypothetical protein ABSA46_15135 [Thermodesulfovibrionales bacterium]|jgi:rubrerythrin